MTFPELLRQTRKAHNVSQRALCLKIGMDTAYYSKLETGKLNHTPTHATIEKIARGIECTAPERHQLLIRAGRFYVLPPNVEGCREVLAEIFRRHPELKDEVK